MDRRHADAQPLTELGRILLGLDGDIARQERSFGRVIADPLDAQQIFKLQLRLDQRRQQGDGGFDVGIGLAGATEAGLKIDLDRLSPQQAIHGDPIEARELLKFLKPRSALALLDGDDRSPS
ncbi:MAG TPA: hypothetical protein VME40_13615, partial [Caulobacteraceae bacterium]|nr:hypothetical protein [Caulobacteraceae bacterium]